MAVYNRFELLVSLTAPEEFDEPIAAVQDTSIETTQVINIEEPQRAKNQWEIPEYVDKPVPCVSNVITQSPSATIVKVRKNKPAVKKSSQPMETVEREESEDEQQPVEVPVKQNEPIVWSYHPPQPHKFKQTPAGHPNQSAPKFDRKMNALPKHMSSRGNTKARTHQL